MLYGWIAIIMILWQRLKDVVCDSSVVCERLDALVPDPKLIAAEGPVRLADSGAQSQ